MKRSIKIIIKIILKVTLAIGCIFGLIYLGIMIGEIEDNGLVNFVKVQGINVLFGVIGGLITAGMIYYFKNGYENLRHIGKQDQILSGHWDEYYEPNKFKEEKQEQCLLFKIKQKAEILTGLMTATDNPDYPSLPDKDRHGMRMFLVNGRVEGRLVSLSAILDSDDSIGHTVYLLQINHNYTVLEGITIYFDKNENVLTTAKSRLVKRKTKNKG